MRLLLSALLAFWTPFVQAGEPSFDALSHLLHSYAGPVDEKAAEAAPEPDVPPESGARLAKIQADLSLMAEGFETFRHPGHARHALRDLPDHVVPELRPFFKDRDATLDTIYRTLAVADYTWALRFPEPACDPRLRRNRLLSSRDGLFADAKVGGLSPWLARLLGPSAFGRTAEEALDRASSRQALSSRDYELVRVKVARITDALTSEKAVGQERAKLYCLRADAYETLAFAHRATEGTPIQAALGTGPADAPEKEASSVLLIALADGPGRFRAVGAGVMVQTAQGPRVLSDSRLLPAEGEDRSSLRAFARAKDGSLSGPRAFLFERADQASGIMVGRLPEAGVIPALKISRSSAARRDFLRAIGHMSASGAWTVSQGLVTETANGTFASDAILGPGMLGGPLLDGSGEVAGLVVLSPGAGSPVAVDAAHLSRVVNGAAPATREIEFVVGRQSGSASLLTTALPMSGDIGVPGGGAIEAGLPDSLGGVNWSGGGGVGNWRPTRSAGRPGGYSSSGSSSYGSNSSAEAGAEIGQALGKAMAPLVEALIFKGIPALFRGIGSMFKSRPRGSSPAVAHAKSAESKKVEEPAPKPKPEVTVTFLPTSIEPGKEVVFTLTAKSNSADAKTGGLRFNFTVTNDMETSTGTAVTDESGTAILRITPSPAARSFTELQKESDRHPALINTGRETNAEQICKIILPGSLALGTLTVAMVAASSPPGMTLLYVGGSQCVAAATGLMAGAGLFCTIQFGQEALAQSRQPAAPTYSPPANPPAAFEKPESAIDAVRSHAKSSDEGMEAEARKLEAAGSTPGDPNRQPEDPDDETVLKKWNRSETLQDHFDRHGADFESKSPADYVRKAVDFFERAKAEGYEMKYDGKIVRIYDPKTNTFGSYGRDGSVRTFYRPDPKLHGRATNWEYWLDQPGVPR